MCAFDRDIRLRDGTTTKQKIKDFGCGLHKIIAGWENMKKIKNNISESYTEGIRTCVLV